MNSRVDQLASSLNADTLPRARGVVQWYRDPISCLQSTLATLLAASGADPLEALGLGWEFRHVPSDTRPEEFYWPCRYPDDLARSVLPHDEVASAWRRIPADDPLTGWESALADGRLPIVAVDNFHLPFRPAYRDVHAAHLVVVYDIDRDAGIAGISDAMPPAHLGPLPIADLLRACLSANPRGDQDVFFSGAHIDGRWLDVRFLGPFPGLSGPRLRAVLAANLSHFADGDEGPGWTGVTGVTRFCAELTASARRGEPHLIAETYAFGWGAQAQAALHGELLRRCGWRWEVPELGEAGRRVERVGHRWASLRVAAAHGQAEPKGCAGQLRRHADGLLRSYDEALASIETAVDALGRTHRGRAYRGNGSPSDD